MLGLRSANQAPASEDGEAPPTPASPDGDPPLADVDWRRLAADGRLHRLRRGRHFRANAPVLLHEAQMAADELGLRAITYHDRIGKFEYIWVQFVDGRSSTEEPCPTCGGLKLERTQEFFLRCLACGALHQIKDRRPPTKAAEFLGARLLSLEGNEVIELPGNASAIIEAVCHFTRPVAAAHFSMPFIFNDDKRTVLRSGSPDVVEVPAADTVRARLQLDARLLRPGEYRMKPRVEVVLDERDRRRHDVSWSRSLHLFVVGDADERLVGPPADRSGLHWEILSSGGQPLPIVGPGDVDDEADEIDGEAAGDP